MCGWCGAASVMLAERTELETMVMAMTRENRLSAMEGEVQRLRTALGALSAPVPSTKGMAPGDRADRLHAEFERRVVAARRVLDGGK